MTRRLRDSSSEDREQQGEHDNTSRDESQELPARLPDAMDASANRQYDDQQEECDYSGHGSSSAMIAARHRGRNMADWSLADLISVGSGLPAKSPDLAKIKGTGAWTPPLEWLAGDQDARIIGHGLKHWRRRLRMRRLGKARLRRVLVVVTALVIVASIAVGPPTAGAIEVGERAPDFTLPSTNGVDISLSDFKGKSWVFLEFYAAAYVPT